MFDFPDNLFFTEKAIEYFILPRSLGALCEFHLLFFRYLTSSILFPLLPKFLGLIF